MLAGRYWEMVERLKVNHFYTSPSAIRKLMKADRNYADNYDLSSLKTIASGNVIITKCHSHKQQYGFDASYIHSWRASTNCCLEVVL